MRCAHCKSRDVDIAHVRECSGVINPPSGPTEPNVGNGPMWPPSEPQVQYVIGLQQSRTLPDEYDVLEAPQIRLMERDQVSKRIGELKAFPYTSPTGRGQQVHNYTMAEGRYALNDPIPGSTADGWKFYQVDKPTTGRWKGYTFIKRLIGQPGDYKKVNVEATVRYQILDAIEANPLKAMVDYGKHSSHCGKCGSALSNDDKPGPDGLTSIKRGIGPICAAKMGMY